MGKKKHVISEDDVVIASNDDEVNNTELGRDVMEIADVFVPPQERNDLSKLCESLDGAIELATVLQQPSISDSENLTGKDYIARIIDVINGGAKFATKVVVRSKVRIPGRTKLVKPDCIGILLNNQGRVYAVGEGIWMSLSPLIAPKAVYDFTVNPFEFEALSIVRVPYGKYGRAKFKGMNVLLAEGLHISNSRQFRFSEFVDIDQEHIQHDTLHVLRIVDGTVGLVREGQARKMIMPGVYTINSPTFEYAGSRSANEHYIEHGTKHVVRVTKGQVALITVSGRPLLVDREGTYGFTSNSFQFVRCMSQTEKAIVHEALKVITVDAGCVGVVFRGGTLDVLAPGRHFINDPKTEFVNFLSTQAQSTPLKLNNKKDLQLETDNFAKISVFAEVFYYIDGIVGAQKALSTLGRSEEISNILVKSSVSTLSAIVRETSLIGLWQEKMAMQKKAAERKMKEVDTGDDVDLDDEAKFAKGKRKNVFGLYDRFNNHHCRRLCEDFHEQHGIVITSLRIGDIEILSKEISSTVSQLAIGLAEMQIQLATAENQKRVEVANEQKKREVSLIEVDTAAEVMRRKAEATRVAGAIERENMIRFAEAEAEAKLIKSKAEADAVRVKGEADAELALKLSKIPNAVESQQLQITMDALVQAMANTEKMVLPADSGSNPFLALMAAQSGILSDGGGRGKKVSKGVL